MHRFFNTDKLFALLFLIFGFLMLQQAHSAPEILMFADEQTHPMAYPKVLIWSWIVLSALYLILPTTPAKEPALHKALPRLGLAAGAILLYALLFACSGLFVSTFLFMLLFLFTQQYRGVVKMVGISLITAALCQLIFVQLLGMQMPGNLLSTLFH